LPKSENISCIKVNKTNNIIQIEKKKEKKQNKIGHQKKKINKRRKKFTRAIQQKWFEVIDLQQTLKMRSNSLVLGE